VLNALLIVKTHVLFCTLSTNLLKLVFIYKLSIFCKAIILIHVILERDIKFVSKNLDILNILNCF